MAKARKRKPAAAPKSTPWIGVALYNLGEETERGSRLRTILATAGVAVRTIRPSDLGSPVGAIAGLPGFKMGGVPFAGAAPEEEFMLVCGIAGDGLNALLALMREADAQVGCKATVTQFNRMWPMATLIAEVAREHAAMNG